MAAVIIVAGAIGVVIVIGVALWIYVTVRATERDT